MRRRQVECLFLLFVTTSVAVMPQYWETLTPESTPPHGAISCCPVSDSQVMAIEASTSSMFMYQTETGAWKRAKTGNESVNIGPDGIFLGQKACLFFGGQAYKPSSDMALISQNGAWNTITGHAPSNTLFFPDPHVSYLDPYYFVSGNGYVLYTTFKNATVAENQADFPMSPFGATLRRPGDTEDRGLVVTWVRDRDLYLLNSDATETVGSFRLDKITIGLDGDLTGAPTALAPPPPELCAVLTNHSTSYAIWAKQLIMGQFKNGTVIFYMPPLNRFDQKAPNFLASYDPLSDMWKLRYFNRSSAPTPAECNLLTNNIYLYVPTEDASAYHLLCSSRQDANALVRVWYLSRDIYTDSWVPIPSAVDALPSARAGASLGVSRDVAAGRLYLLLTGGYVGGNQVLADTWMGYFRSGSWLSLPNLSLPQPRAFHAVFLHGSIFYLLGGFTTGRAAPASFGMMFDIPDMNIENYHWMTYEPTASDPSWKPDLPLWGFASAMDKDAGLVYIAGGVRSTQGWIYRLDLVAARWLEPFKPEYDQRTGIWPGMSFPSMVYLPEMRELCIFGGVIPLVDTVFGYPFRLPIDNPTQYYVMELVIEPNMNFYPNRYSSALFYLGAGDFGIFAGQAQAGSNNDLQVFNYYTHRTQTLRLANSPGPQVFHAIAQIEGIQIFVGGAYSGDWNLTAALETLTFGNTSTMLLHSCPEGAYFVNGGCSVCDVLDGLPGSQLFRELGWNCLHATSIFASRLLIWTSQRVISSAGYYSTGGATECTRCPAGTYGPFKGQGACNALCPAGFYSSELGATTNSTCQPCKPGTYSEQAGAPSIAHCLLCPPGTYATQAHASSRTACVPCPEGSTCRWGSTGSTMTMETNLPKMPPIPDLKDAEYSTVTVYLYIGLGAGVALVAIVITTSFLLFIRCRLRVRMSCLPPPA
ncbi:hypothetical protein PAPYR_10090 [Paratrimastix pyriformis]|uniref:Tyrosine-protein kinase ephrin type A/B receptor-like domain-containing protein n=1 Tax=Paratrimastix pyriformis TaxID=342808 RepID=A0ABQ8U6M8_9EUKA|nr:hypothetical protein PAPYR_10090 [Paratrimastix pyriformis]